MHQAVQRLGSMFLHTSFRRTNICVKGLVRWHDAIPMPAASTAGLVVMLHAALHDNSRFISTHGFALLGFLCVTAMGHRGARLASIAKTISSPLLYYYYLSS